MLRLENLTRNFFFFMKSVKIAKSTKIKKEHSKKHLLHKCCDPSFIQRKAAAQWLSAVALKNMGSWEIHNRKRVMLCSSAHSIFEHQLTITRLVMLIYTSRVSVQKNHEKIDLAWISELSPLPKWLKMTNYAMEGLPRSQSLQNGAWHQFHYKGDANMAARWSS